MCKLAKKHRQFKVDDLGRILIYILGHRPDEFCLVPDRDGFVPLKELLRALHEEPAWRYVRPSHVNEVMISDFRDRLEVSEKGIRAAERNWAFEPAVPWEELPAVLFLPVRRKAHPVVLDKGLRAPPGGRLVLTGDRAAAERIGMRRDPHPVLLEVRAAEAARRGTGFESFGELLLCDAVPAQWIAGPPAPRDVMERSAADKAGTQKAAPSKSPFSAGTFVLRPDRTPDAERGKKRGKKAKGWKEEARKMRKRKQIPH